MEYQEQYWNDVFSHFEARVGQGRHLYETYYTAIGFKTADRGKNGESSIRNVVVDVGRFLIKRTLNMHTPQI